MDAQPNEIITHILSYLDNHTLMFARVTCQRWKYLIETRLFYKSTISTLHVCLVDQDYYHFGKYHLNHVYNIETKTIGHIKINDSVYYDNLVRTIANKIFQNIIPQTKIIISTEHLLVYASYRGHFEVVQYLINKGADVRAHKNYAIRLSAENGHLEIVQYLINKGADVHAHNDDAIRLSAKQGHLEVVKYLVSVGADIHADDDDDDIPLILSALDHHFEVFKYLISVKYDIDSLTYILSWIASDGNLEMVEYLVNLGADIHDNNDYALQCSAENGHLEIVKYLINMGANLHANNDYALRWSAEKGHLEIVKYLINMGADVHADNDFALRYGTPEVIEFLKSMSQ